MVHELHPLNKAYTWGLVISFKWQQVMADELHPLNKAHTWELVDLSLDKSVISFKRVNKIKA